MKFNELANSFDGLTKEWEMLDALSKINDGLGRSQKEEKAREWFAKFLQTVSDNVSVMSPSLMKMVGDGVINAFNKRMGDCYSIWLPIIEIEEGYGLGKDDKMLKIDFHDTFPFFVQQKLFGEKSSVAFYNYIKKHLDHFKQIRQLLASNMDLISELWDRPISETKISFDVMGADQHGYFPPTAITLEHNGKTKKLIYKSRLGHADCLVTELFRAINDKVGRNILPYYNQKSLDNGHLLSEFVSGELVTTVMPKNPQTGAGNVVERFMRPASFWSTPLPEFLKPKQLELSGRIATLDYVAKQIGLTDLHGDNAIYDSESNFVIPIDLEAFDCGKATGLYGHEEHETGLAPADEQHKELIDGIIKSHMPEIEASERRLVPVETSKLYESVSDGIEATFTLLKETLEKTFEVNSDNLTEYVTRCVNGKEKLIPAFTLRQRILYGAPIEGEKIIVAKQQI